MAIERLHKTRLDHKTETEIATLLSQCFGTEFGGRSYFMQRYHIRFLARRDGLLIGHAGVITRSVRQDERLIPIIGLGDVATHPDTRGQGVASQLVQALIDEAHQSVAHFVMLFWNRAPIRACRISVREKQHPIHQNE